MQKPVNKRQLAWNTPVNNLSLDNLLDFADEIASIAEFGIKQNLSITFSGSTLPLQLTGDPIQVREELNTLPDKQFATCAISALFPDINNLNLTINIIISYGQISTVITDGTDKEANHFFNLVRDTFPRSEGLTDIEFEQQSNRLSNMIKEAERNINTSRDSKKHHQKIIDYNVQAEEIIKKIDTMKNQLQETSDNIKKNHTEMLQLTTEASQYKAQIQADRDITQSLKDGTTANEAKIKDFFSEIATYQNVIKTTTGNADKKIKEFTDTVEQIIEDNINLQTETKKHLLKAVGASFFSAFETRKQKIVISKWVWAGLTGLAICSQIFIIIWLAHSAQTINGDAPFYQTPFFLLRATASVPIIFFIGYAIHQYAREREYEELYGFKSTLSFSLAPYLDLVSELKTKSENEEYNSFVITTIKQIFENPLHLKHEKEKESFFETSMLKDILDRVIKLVEKGK